MQKSPQKNFDSKALTFSEADDRMRDIFANHDFDDITHVQRKKLTEFFFLLMEAQKYHNSTRLRSLREVAIKHYIDSIMVLRITVLEFPILDVGTGPGFPGIPLKIMLPEEPIILAEGVQKRVEFLKQARESLELSKLDIIGRQVTEEFQYPVQAVITRAFADVSDTLTQVQNCLKKNGKAFLMKGPRVDKELVEAEKRFKGKFRLVQNTPYKLPKTPHERRLVVFEKL